MLADYLEDLTDWANAAVLRCGVVKYSAPAGDAGVDGGTP